MTHIRILLLSMALSAGTASAAVPVNYPTEFWVNQEQGWVVETKVCNTELCGYLVGYKPTLDRQPEYMPKDAHNPDPSRRAQPLCGLMLMGGFKPPKRPDGDWEGGWVYDPDTGSTYSGAISMVDAGTVKLRGYIGIPFFGRTLTLHRAAMTSKRCAAPGG